VSAKVIEKLASWCSRYFMILPILKLLSVVVYEEHAGMVNRQVQ